MLALVPSSLALPLTSQGKLSAESLPSRAGKGKPSNELQQQSGILLPDFSWRAVGECEEWCGSHTKSWSEKCAWSNGFCSACATCADTSVANCENWVRDPHHTPR